MSLLHSRRVKWSPDGKQYLQTFLSYFYVDNKMLFRSLFTKFKKNYYLVIAQEIQILKHLLRVGNSSRFLFYFFIFDKECHNL